MRHPFRAAAVAALAFAFGILPASSRAETKPVGWSANINLGAVLTQGNTETVSATLKARVERNWLRTLFYIDGSGMRQDATDNTSYAVGDASFVQPNGGAPGKVCTGTCVVFPNSVRSTKAEKYSFDMGFERRITERVFWDAEGAYDRDLFSGVQRKVAGRLGVGYVWSSRDNGDFKLGVQATYTDQQEINPNPDTKDHYVGGRVTAEYDVKFGMTKQNTFNSKLAADEDLQVTNDFRTTWDNTLTVNMTQKLSLQVGDKLAFRNLPALNTIPLFASQALAQAAGASGSGQTLTPFKKVDNTVQVTLVISWTPHAPTASRPTR
ncbi:MAG TPA: DUF481 domain-containing protein [Vicinamibacteria bacterium]|jgi:hypothetical protein|nr:DUF481 domain-containing protein [Vicinamibacteria bacterium]